MTTSEATCFMESTSTGGSRMPAKLYPNNTNITITNSSDDDELSVPRAAMNKMIKDLLPHIRVANESRELLLNVCTEFIHLVASEANELCNKQQKKTISPEHVLEALDSLGFSNYKEEAKAVLQEAKAVATNKRQKRSKLEDLGIPEEELLRQQQELFAKARLEVAQLEQQEWQEMQLKLQQQHPTMSTLSNQNTYDDDNDYN